MAIVFKGDKLHYFNGYEYIDINLNPKDYDVEKYFATRDNVYYADGNELKNLSGDVVIKADSNIKKIGFTNFNVYCITEKNDVFYIDEKKVTKFNHKARIDFDIFEMKDGETFIDPFGEIHEDYYIPEDYQEGVVIGFSGYEGFGDGVAQLIIGIGFSQIHYKKHEINEIFKHEEKTCVQVNEILSYVIPVSYKKAILESNDGRTCIVSDGKYRYIINRVFQEAVKFKDVRLPVKSDAKI